MPDLALLALGFVLGSSTSLYLCWRNGHWRTKVPGWRDDVGKLGWCPSCGHHGGLHYVGCSADSDLRERLETVMRGRRG